MPLTYTDCLNAIRHHRREAAWCELRSNESLYSSAYLCREYEELAAGHRETAREYAGVAWEMRAKLRRMARRIASLRRSGATLTAAHEHQEMMALRGATMRPGRRMAA